ncbi:DUF4222 domain-containing protein [Salmonella enterica]|uniref:DUF4222 domain-containing protein n=1 Tax=Salmonella enterica TaxID=28901 RepID=UPI0012F1C355|nr:DUF4222 domain-containing protein [Salmonella enterica]EBQ9004523.1 hypothetical protein [Salmonella enterica subsp. enterica serovar Blockley]ECS7526343.1 DUF4222 domain-containing protein [Salmonella enterica]ECW2125703.1 DUF4222 domain-containing protein [Salmonella enterica]
MRRFHSGLTASGCTHPEIKAGDIYRDNKGRLVTVDKCESGRVHFVREGFPFSVSLVERVLLDRFRLHRRRKAPVMSANAVKKVQKFRRMINASRDREVVK